MKKTRMPVLAILLAGLSLTACDKAPDSAAPEPQPGAQATSLKRDLDPAQVARGRVIYDKHCAECHGADGKGQPGDWRVRNADGNYPPPPLNDDAHAWHHPTEGLLETIRMGSPQGMGIMPGFRQKLTEHEIVDVVTYIKSLWSDPIFRQWLDIEQQSLGG